MLDQISFIFKKRQKRSGFSLIMVLVFTLLGFALSGAALLFYENFLRRSESLLARQEEYNAMQGVIESTRLRLREAGFPRADITSDVADVSDLPNLLNVWSGDINVRIMGRNQTVRVDVYDSNFLWNDSRFSKVFQQIEADTSLLKNLPTQLPPLLGVTSSVASDLVVMETSGSAALHNERFTPEALATEDRLRIYTIRTRIAGKQGRGLESVNTMVVPEGFPTP